MKGGETQNSRAPRFLPFWDIMSNIKAPNRRERVYRGRSYSRRRESRSKSRKKSRGRSCRRPVRYALSKRPHCEESTVLPLYLKMMTALNTLAWATLVYYATQALCLLSSSFLSPASSTYSYIMVFVVLLLGYCEILPPFVSTTLLQMLAAILATVACLVPQVHDFLSI